jgi:chemotaxis protein methyltransferase CheR
VEHKNNYLSRDGYSSLELENKFNPIITSRDLTLSHSTFEKWRKFIYNNCGIYFQDNKKYLLESRLLKRLNTLHLDTYEDYLEYINVHSIKTVELKQLFEAITINETYFFRNQPQFEELSKKILPEILSSKINSFNPKIRIWSAASSSGDEAYTTAILINELVQPKFPGVTFEIIGSDINNEVLEKARKGVYKEYSVRNTPIYYLKKYFRRVGNEYLLDPNIIKMVKFEELNLYDDLKMKLKQNFDVIFCSNVLIYFDTKSKIKVVNHLYNSMNQGAYLFIGYSETMHGISNAFQLVSFPKTIAYKKT